MSKALEKSINSSSAISLRSSVSIIDFWAARRACSQLCPLQKPYWLEKIVLLWSRKLILLCIPIRFRSIFGYLVLYFVNPSVFPDSVLAGRLEVLLRDSWCYWGSRCSEEQLVVAGAWGCARQGFDTQTEPVRYLLCSYVCMCVVRLFLSVFYFSWCTLVGVGSVREDR